MNHEIEIVIRNGMPEHSKELAELMNIAGDGIPAHGNAEQRPLVIPAKAEIQWELRTWIPAFAGMTDKTAFPYLWSRMAGASHDAMVPGARRVRRTDWYNDGLELLESHAVDVRRPAGS